MVYSIKTMWSLMHSCITGKYRQICGLYFALLEQYTIGKKCCRCRCVDDWTAKITRNVSDHIFYQECCLDVGYHKDRVVLIKVEKRVLILLKRHTRDYCKTAQISHSAGFAVGIGNSPNFQTRFFSDDVILSRDFYRLKPIHIVYG